MSASPDLAQRIARLNALRSRLGLAAVLCALAAVALAAMGMTAAGPWRTVAFALLAVGGGIVLLRLRLGWQSFKLAQLAHAQENALPPRDSSTS